LSLAVQFLGNPAGALNFLPPKPTLWQQVSQRYSGRRLAYTGATAGAVATLVLGLFLFQSLRLAGLNQDWQDMESKVTELDHLQAQIRAFRPWYDPDITSLSILQRVTEAFPEEGSVTAKSVEIRNQTAVNISGVTRDNAALLATLDQLRKSAEIAGVKVETIRGKTPMQFTFNFHWEGRP
jgi:Tfp pilus assembly protein PilN